MSFEPMNPENSTLIGFSGQTLEAFAYWDDKNWRIVTAKGKIHRLTILLPSLGSDGGGPGPIHLTIATSSSL